MFELWQTILGAFTGPVESLLEGAMNKMKMQLTPEERQALQDQNAMRQQALSQQALMAQNYAITTGSTTATNINPYASLGNTTNTSTSWMSPPMAQYGAYTPQIDRLEKLEPGWLYVRWRKPDDKPAEAWVVPIIALTVVSGRVEYQLAGATVQAQGELRPETFLGILTPRDTYDAEVWNAKARDAYYEFHAAEVAAALLRGMAQGAKTTP